MHLAFKKVSIRYGKKQIVRDIDIDLPKGKIVTLVGKNGSGKSSLIKGLTKSVDIENGEIHLDGKPIDSFHRKDLARKMAILPQVPSAPLDIDVQSLVSYGRFPYKKFARSYSREDEAIIDETLKMMHLDDLRFQKIMTLSGGERQRARIAMAVCQRPQILVLDEPTTYLDIAYQLDILNLIKRINRELNITIFMVLHDLNLAAKYSDIIYVVDDQNIFSSGDVHQVVSEKMLEQVFGIDVAMWHDNPTGKPYFIPLRLTECKN
ncbi:MAG: iron ABC transporter ATP-binding protein [Clostridiales bacterium]|nr:MAG: iron ABC transporter ATP-binding protein [Clostridiales bacterium]